MSSASPLPMPPQPASASGVEKKVYEPSMEEILASIRRIIADDQSLPGRGAASEAFASPLPHVAPEPASVAQFEEPSAASPAPEPAPAPIAYGSVAAPQFAMPHPMSAPTAAPVSAMAPAAAAQPPIQEGYDRSVAPQSDPVEPEAIEPFQNAPNSVVERAVEDVPAFVSEGYGSSFEDVALYETSIAPPDDGHGAEAHVDEVRRDEPAPAAAATSESHDAEANAALFSDATDSSVTSAFNMLAASRLADNSDELMNLAREMIRPLLRTWLDDNLPSMVERMVRAEIERVARGGR